MDRVTIVGNEASVGILVLLDSYCDGRSAAVGHSS
jgi:hypothetical protein